MSRVSRGAFQQTLANGIDLGAPDLADDLMGTGVSEADLAKADLNGDGLLFGDTEIRRAFTIVDGVDHDGSSKTFETTGDAGAVYRALQSARRPPPDGVASAQAARDRVTSDGPDYARTRSPTSPLDRLSGNTRPGQTHPGWLAGQNKCNQFVGDVLTQAGVAAPTVTMRDGSLHYATAESWPTYHNLFSRVTDPKDIRPGDILVRDYLGAPGANGGHIEVVTGTGPLRTTGAHETGAYETDNDWLDGARYQPASRSFSDAVGDDLYILRPTKYRHND